MLRPSLLFHFRHGDHACVFYPDEDSLCEVLTPFIAEGLRRGERCFCAQKRSVAKRLLFDLRFLGIDTENAIQTGALELHTPDEVYFPNGKFEPQALVHMLVDSMQSALQRGFTAFRTAGELSWAVDGGISCDQLLVYEEIIDRSFPHKSVVGLCQYDMRVFPPQTLERVIEAHRMQLYELKAHSMYSALSVRHNDCWAEIVADKLVLDPSFYYVVQRQRPSEIVGWGTAPDYKTAADAAEELAAAAARP